MQLIVSEQQWNSYFTDTSNLYKGIVERLYIKTISRANNKNFAHNYFLKHLEYELDFQKGFSFNSSVLKYFQVSYNMGFAWSKFLKEVRIMQKIHTYRDEPDNTNEYVMLCAEFTPPEVKRIIWESKIVNDDRIEDSIYKYIQCRLLTKRRDVDFIRYIAKYKSVFDFINQKRIEYENQIENNTNTIRISNDNIRWNGTKGKKIELIRLLVALNDCKYFETDKGLIPSQDQLMNYFGEILSVNLKHYEQDLSNGFESKLQTNIAVFDKLKQAIEKRFQLKVEQLG